MEWPMTKTMETVTTIDLGYEQMFVFDGGAGARVRVLYGATWLTEEGRPGDAIVHTGDEVSLNGGRALVEGLQPSRVQIIAASPDRLARQVGRRLRGFVQRVGRRIARLQLGPVTIVESNG